MRERLGEFIFDGEPFEETYSGVTVAVGCFATLEIHEGKIEVACVVENHDWTEVKIDAVTAREMASKLLEMADELDPPDIATMLASVRDPDPETIKRIRTYGKKTKRLVEMWKLQTKDMGDLAPGYTDWLQHKLVDIYFKYDDVFDDE